MYFKFWVYGTWYPILDIPIFRNNKNFELFISAMFSTWYKYKILPYRINFGYRIAYPGFMGW